MPAEVINIYLSHLILRPHFHRNTYFEVISFVLTLKTILLIKKRGHPLRRPLFTFDF